MPTDRDLEITQGPPTATATIADLVAFVNALSDTVSKLKAEIAELRHEVRGTGPHAD